MEVVWVAWGTRLCSPTSRTPFLHLSVDPRQRQHSLIQWLFLCVALKAAPLLLTWHMAHFEKARFSVALLCFVSTAPSSCSRGGLQRREREVLPPVAWGSEQRGSITVTSCMSDVSAARWPFSASTLRQDLHGVGGGNRGGPPWRRRRTTFCTPIGVGISFHSGPVRGVWGETLTVWTFGWKEASRRTSLVEKMDQFPHPDWGVDISLLVFDDWKHRGKVLEEMDGSDSRARRKVSREGKHPSQRFDGR